MPEPVDEDESDSSDVSSVLAELPFPPVTRRHILNCSYHYWHPIYRTITPKARLIPLTDPFLDYLRADGIVLPSEDVRERPREWSDTDSGIFSASDNLDSDDEDEDVAAEWRGVHNAIRDTIAELGGKVLPKLNWSAPKDATWINANSMECRNPNDVYLLLKSSDFITHDLEHAFDDTAPTSESQLPAASIPYHLVLRKAVGRWNPSVEFRCFVRNRQLLCMCQRDMNHYSFLAKMAPRLRSRIQAFFDVRLRDTFPDQNFVFDAYVPPPHDRVWLVDINPWAPRTDPLLFSWLEVLEMPEPPTSKGDESEFPEFVRLSLRSEADRAALKNLSEQSQHLDPPDEHDSSDSDDYDEEIWLPELRLIDRSDPEAYGINAQQYSAHKLPKDVVDASQSGEGLREFARDWQNILAKRQKEEDLAESSGDD